MMTHRQLAGALVLAQAALLPAPDALEVSPSAWNAQDWIEVAIQGSPIAAPDSVCLLPTTGGSLPADWIEIGPEAITCRFDLTHASPGPCDLLLSTATGDAHVEPGCFEVLAAARHPEWAEPARLTSEPEISDRPRMAIDGRGRVHLVWHNKLTAVARYNIYYRRLEGDRWTDAEMLNLGG